MSRQANLRAAYVHGALDASPQLSGAEVAARAYAKYPDRFVNRPRELKVGFATWFRVVDGALQIRVRGADFAFDPLYDAADTEALRQLLNQPTEKIPADD